MFTVTLFTTAKSWKQPKCPSSNEWINKLWPMYTRKHYLAIKRNQIQIYVTTWMKLKNTILS